ncbi:MAG: hypothetical protein ACOWW1_00165 [archaeon]
MHGKRLYLVCIIFCILVIFNSTSVVFPSSQMWSNSFGTGTGCSVVQTSDGDFALAGTTYGDADFWLIGIDEYGNMKWNKTYGGPESESAKVLIGTSDGGFALVGYSGNCDCWLVKTDSFGNMEWNQTYGGQGYDYANSLIETSDGGYAIGGSYNPDSEDPFGDRDFWLVKTDAYGNMEWNQTYGGLGYDYVNSLVETSDGGYLLVGNTGLYLVESNVWIIKTDAQGNLQWDREFGGKGSSGVNSVVKTSDDGYALAGFISQDFWLIKIDRLGNLQWNQTHSKLSTAEAYSLIETSEGGYALAGCVSSGNAGGSEGWLVKTDTNGNEIWNQTYNGIENYFIYSLIETSDGEFALAGYKTSSYPNLPDLLLIKTDGYGNVPEIPSLVIVPFLVMTTSIALIFKKKLKKTLGR